MSEALLADTGMLASWLSFAVRGTKRDNFGTTLGRLWDFFGTTLGCLCDDFGRTFGGLWEDFWRMIFIGLCEDLIHKNAIF